MNKPAFYEYIKAPLFQGKLFSLQVTGMERYFSQYEKSGWNDLRKLAYAFATGYHETGRKMMPCVEIGLGSTKLYGKRDPKTGQRYYGRGDVQLTWKDNYARFGTRLKLDLVNKPDLALNADISIRIMFEGMENGLFTGKQLKDYFNATACDWINARRIINGTNKGDLLPDKAELIASYAKVFYEALTKTT
jgi:putative chitinase